ncbi:hypothetical protein CB0940_10328 [Cercospora beticola]|uniref:Uncharacterized protein n=1 Tax=Cercospora beticola TaxID=122368 RepID=A0A2G5HUD9_CERBT|nr:hypothetical protein CB0940_10328 [Cercospora beticola]PIA96150.1 hypothetical protein CB0940_10328 [Cercospora beticola]WPB07037.1 hypothetical protein RHO25_011697 [Cercospora beticola]
MRVSLPTSLIALSGLVAAAGPTITLGPASEYQKAPAVTASPSGNDLIITPADIAQGIPKEGLDVFLGPDMQSDLSKDASDICKQGIAQDCTNAISGVLNKDYGLTLQARQITVLFTGVQIFGLVIAAIVANRLANEAHPKLVSHVHIPSSLGSQLASLTAGEVAFATATNEPAVTIKTSPTPTLESSPASITTLAADGGGHSKGDLIVRIPEQKADLLKQLLRQTGIEGKCNNVRRRISGAGPTASNYNLINNAALWALPMAAPGQLLASLGLQVQQVPQLLLQLRDDAARSSLDYVQTNAGRLTEFANVSADQFKAVSLLVWKATSDMCLGSIDQLAEIVLDDSMFLDDPSREGDDNEDKKCPKDVKDRPACDSQDCAGADDRCQQGTYKSCLCLKTVEVYVNPLSRDDLDAGQKFLTEALDDEDEPAKFDCNKDERVSLEYADYLRLSGAFCKNIDMSKDAPDVGISPKDAGTRGPYTNYKFSFSWKPKSGVCSSDCAAIFGAFNTSSVCSYDSHTMAKSGSQELSCGTASFDFGNGKTKDGASGQNQPPKSGSETNLECGKESDMGNANHFVAPRTMDRAARFFCQQQIDRKTRFEPAKVLQDQGRKELHYNQNLHDPVYLSVDWLDNASCPVTDFGAIDFMKTCTERFGALIHSCDTNNPKGLNFWKQGGTLTRDCVKWTIKRDTFAKNPPNDSDLWRPKDAPCSQDSECSKVCNQYGKPVCKKAPEFSDQGWCGCDTSNCVLGFC